MKVREVRKIQYDAKSRDVTVKTETENGDVDLSMSSIVAKKLRLALARVENGAELTRRITEPGAGAEGDVVDVLAKRVAQLGVGRNEDAQHIGISILARDGTYEIFDLNREQARDLMERLEAILSGSGPRPPRAN